MAAALGDFKGDEGAFSTETKLLQSAPSQNQMIKRKQLAVAALVAAIAIWGSTFVFGAIAMRELIVLQTGTLRFVIAALLLLPMALWQREYPRPRD